MPEVVALFKTGVVGEIKIGNPEEAARVTKEPIVVNEATGTWCFGDAHKFSQFGPFKLGQGPGNEQKEQRHWYPQTIIVFDRTDDKQLAEAFDFRSAESFGSGYDAGGAIDD